MKNKRIQLPKEGLAEPEDLRPPDFIDASKDVEGHGFPNPAPPAEFTRHGAGHGGEAMPRDDEGDVEGNRSR
jgi:hypothetical protein